MSLLKDLEQWLNLGANGFWSQRADMYRDIARSIEGKELFRDFVEGELTIALSKRTQNKVRAKGLMHMRGLMDAGGLSLADILIATMPKKDHMALGILRKSNEPIEALNNLAKNVDEQKAMTKLVMKSLISPITLIPVGFIFAYVLATVAIPEFVKTAPPEIWTGFNYVVRVTAEAFQTYGVGVFSALCAFTGWLLIWGLPNLTANWRFVAEGATGKERLMWNLIFPFRPVLQMYRDIQGTRFLSDLSFLLKSGMLLQDAIETMMKDATPWMRKHLMMILGHLQTNPGDHIGAFSQGVLSQFIAGRLHSAVRRDSGQFSNVLVDIGSKGQADAQAALGASASRFSAILHISVMSVIIFFYGGQAAIIKSIEEANSPSAVTKREAARQRQQQKMQAGANK